jgi:hypothetical protein
MKKNQENIWVKHVKLTWMQIGTQKTRFLMKFPFYSPGNGVKEVEMDWSYNIYTNLMRKRCGRRPLGRMRKRWEHKY